MHSAGPPPSAQNQSCPSPSLAQCPSPSLLQQGQHVLYGPITTLQPCPTNLHPRYVYAGVQRNSALSGTSGPLANQVPIRQTKITKWQPKSKPTRGHQHHHPSHYPQYCQPLQQSHVQQPMSYISKPLILADQTGQPPPGLPPSASFLVASSNVTNVPWGPSDYYAASSGLTLIPQPVWKLPEVTQAFCLLPERSQSTHHPHQQPIAGGQSQASYYNISAKPAYHPTNIGNPYGNVAIYGNGQTTATSQIFQSMPPANLTFGPQSRDKLSMSVDLQAMTCSRNLTIPGDTRNQGTLMPRVENIEWPNNQAAQDTSNGIFEISDPVTSPKMPSSPMKSNRLGTSLTRNLDERYSDESGASFDFTIEAEKMVSALCNTASSNELLKDETRGQHENSACFGGAAGDNVTNKTNTWFADFCNDYGIAQNNRGTQTQEDRHDPQCYPETMRKTIYWGCSEVESVLNSSNCTTARDEWLTNLSCATRTAVTKSSTCFPIYCGDRTCVQDLVNAHLRISNGWLILDNYLNKQHYPSLSDKFDRELTSRFQLWEVITQDLMRELIKTLVRIDENRAVNSSLGLEHQANAENPWNTSFPGDINLYTNNDLFDSSQRNQEHLNKFNNCPGNERDATYTLQCSSQSTSNVDPEPQSQKETKLRSKWTITENLSSTVDSAKSILDMANEPSGYGTGNRYRVKNSSNTSTTKITSSTSRLNAEFFHLRNKVMERMGNSCETDRQLWGMKEQQYDFVFGTSRGNTSGHLADNRDPIFKIRTAGTSYENAYARRCLPRVDSINNPITQPTQSVDRSVYVLAGNETAMDSTYTTSGVGTVSERSKKHAEPDYTGNVKIGELTEVNCGSSHIVTSIASSRTEPVYVGKASFEQRELAPIVPKTKMTLLSQIEGNTPNANGGRDTKEMTANLSAWFASMRNSSGGHRTVNCPMDGRKSENATISVRTSTHPQETSRSAMDLSRQLHMDGNRQLKTLQNMQAIQSQPWNAANLLNNKRSNVTRNVDEYDSSEDVRVYMKPGSYNVPKKRHNRKNNRRNDNPAAVSARGSNTPRNHANRPGNPTIYGNLTTKNHHLSSSVSSLLIASSVQVSTTTTTTSTSIRVPFPATPIVPPPGTFTHEKNAKILRCVSTYSNDETRQDVAWKAACASAEILLEALNVKASVEAQTKDPKSSSTKNPQIDSTSCNQDCSVDHSSSDKETKKDCVDFCEASSYEASEDDSSSTCKLSTNRYHQVKSRDVKAPKTNVKTDSWLIRTLNNASIVSAINPKESDAESTIDGSFNSSNNDEGREHKAVVTSTPEPVKPSIDDNYADIMTTIARKLDDDERGKGNNVSPQEVVDHERSESIGNRQTPSRNLSISLIDSSSEFVGKATYSETVRRSTGKSCVPGKMESCRSRQTRSMSSVREGTMLNSIIPIPGRKLQRKDNDKSHQLIHKSRKLITKKMTKDQTDKESEEVTSIKKIGRDSGESFTRSAIVKSSTRKKEDSCGGWIETKTGKGCERGWSVWYSSRRKQTLSQLALNKLTTIHQTVWQMDDAKLLKYPSGSSALGGNEETIEDDGKVIKSPMFLETIGYKLKNRIYQKIEQAMRDFRKIVNNSKLYHKNDTDRIAKIEMLSKKLEELFDEHFANCDLEIFSESPRNTKSSVQQTSRCKSPQRQQQKTSLNRLSNMKNNSSAMTKNEN